MRSMRRIDDQPAPSFVPREKRGEQVAERAKGRLTAGREEQAHAGEDLFVGQAPAVDLARDELADDVFARLRAPGCHDRGKEVGEGGLGLEGALGIVAKGEEREGPRVKLVFSFAGEPSRRVITR